MQKILLLYIFLWISSFHIPLFGQEIEQKKKSTASEIPWQEQILQLVDVEDIGEEAYNELLEELSELVFWKDTLSDSTTRIRQQLILSSSRCLNTRAGFLNQTYELQQKNKAYLGDPWRQAIRYRIQAGQRWEAGVNVEKDPGEAWQSRFPGFDSWHGYVRYKGTENRTDLKDPKFFSIEDAVIGHYRLRMGYGLVMNQSFSLGKQYFSQQLSQRTNRITPFASNAESKFMQGAALDLRVGRHVHIIPFISIAQIDGNLSKNDTLTTLYTDGMHRTQTELSHRHAAWQLVMGTHAGWRGPWYEVGAQVVNTQFQYPYVRKILSHNKNYFRGQTLTQFAIDYQLRAFHNVLKGEFALDDRGGFATLTSLQTLWSDRWQSALIYHYYSNDYRQLHGSSIGENSVMQGEQGLTLNLSGSLTSHWQIQVMADWTTFGQPQYQTIGIPKDCIESLLRVIYTQKRFTLQLGYKVKSKNEYLRHSFDSNIQFTTDHFSLKTQIKKRIYSETKTTSKGFSIAQSIGYKKEFNHGLSLNMDAQATYFDTDDYNSRVYILEKNILYGFGFPMLYNKGVRYNLTCNVKVGKYTHIEAKYALTNYANKLEISTGLQEIKGNIQQDLWLQLRFAF